MKTVIVGGGRRCLAILELLAAGHVRELGVDIQLRTAVEGIEADQAGGIKITLADGETKVDQCLVTSSPAILARLAPSLPSHYLERLLAMKSMGAVTVILALKHRLAEGGIYWHSLPKEAGFPFLSLVEHTNFISPGFFGGDHIVYCGDYLASDHEYFSLSKEVLVERFLPSLARFNPKFEPNWVRDTWMFRTSYAQPVPELNHSLAIPDTKTPIPGLWFASMSQVYPWDRGSNFAVEIARLTAADMLAMD